MSESPIKAKFDFIKSPLFRVVHADGAFGGMTPRGKIFLSFYNERFPIPTAMVHQVKPTGEVGEEIREEREGRKGIVREVDVGIEMDLTVAKSVVEWLQGKIAQVEKHVDSKEKA